MSFCFLHSPTSPPHHHVYQPLVNGLVDGIRIEQVSHLLEPVSNLIEHFPAKILRLFVAIFTNPIYPSGASHGTVCDWQAARIITPQAARRAHGVDQH